MSIYTASCIDKKTGLELILDGVGFNEACYFAELNFNVRDVHHVKDSAGDSIMVISTDTRTLLYDERRGVLVGD